MRAIIVANGKLGSSDLTKARIMPDDYIIAADGGAKHCRSMGISPAAIIGDLDSLSDEELKQLEAAGTELKRHPARKDQSDLELALLYATERGASEILVLAALGGRWDQSLANLLLVAHPRLVGCPITLLHGSQRIRLIRRQATIRGEPGDTISLIPLGGDARGVTTAGLEYGLKEGLLPFGTTLGVSNVMTGDSAEVRLREGLVLCIHQSQTSGGGS